MQQAVEQAALEGVSLSDLEKRMMYFTESQDATEDPIQLNDEFEAKYNMAEYEAKISNLLHHARTRLKKQNPETARQWDQSVRLLRKGDHYILVLLDLKIAPKLTMVGVLKLVGLTVAVSVFGGVALIGCFALAEHYGIHWPAGWKSGTTTHRSLSPWLARSLLAGFAAAYFCYAILPWFAKGLPGNRFRGPNKD